jgi:hypothetical protein
MSICKLKLEVNESDNLLQKNYIYIIYVYIIHIVYMKLNDLELIKGCVHVAYMSTCKLHSKSHKMTWRISLTALEALWQT